MAITRFVLIVYRMPAKPTSARVAVWRRLKKAGAVYLQQSVCVFPDTPPMRRELQPILAKIDASSGSFHLLPLRSLSASEQEKLVEQFQAQSSKQFQEIIENCEINFTKEIEFETFRDNLTYEEAEEIRAEYEKIVSWFERVNARDWFGASNRSEAQQWLDRCARLLEEFEAKVFRKQAALEDAGRQPLVSRRAASRARRSLGRSSRLRARADPGRPVETPLRPSTEAVAGGPTRLVAAAAGDPDGDATEQQHERR
jgi:hypothetical protein